MPKSQTIRRVRRSLLSADPSCAYCGRLLSERTATVDHLHPLSRGGGHVPGNLLLACHDCNQAKGDRTPAEWAADILAAAQRAEKAPENGTGTAVAKHVGLDLSHSTSPQRQSP